LLFFETISCAVWSLVFQIATKAKISKKSFYLGKWPVPEAARGHAGGAENVVSLTAAMVVGEARCLEWQIVAGMS
jgi:hypothetical protein